MKLTLTSEQSQLKDSVARFVAARFPESTRRSRTASSAGLDRTAWREMAGLGWVGAGLSEDEGGWGGGPVEMMVILESAGQGLALQPLVAVAVHALRLAAELQPGSADVAAIVGGEAVVSVAAQDRDATMPAALTAIAGGYSLSGVKRLVPVGDLADGFLVACRLDWQPAVVKVEANTPGVSVVGYRTLDDGRAADVTFDKVEIPPGALLASGAAAQAALDGAEAFAIAAACAEATGIAQFLLDTTLSYVKTRQQFGQVIGRFQAIQHRLADMFVAVEEARSLTMMATAKLVASDGAADRSHSVAAAKAGVMARALLVAREAIQLHGGVGMTEDLPLGAGFRRIKALSLAYGDEHVQLDRMAAGIKSGIYA